MGRYRPSERTNFANCAQPRRSTISIGDTRGSSNDWTERDRQCLEDLRLSDPRHDKKRIERISGGLLQDSYRWILENSDFQLWRDDHESRLLWIKGDPGKGKTMLLCGIIDHLQESAQQTSAKPFLAYFFCQATDSRLNTFTAVLRGLIYMLVDQRPSLSRYVRDEYDRAGKSLFKDTNAWVALSEILTNILKSPNLPTIYLVVDALDECLTDLPQLLDVIVAKSSGSPSIKWLLSSRNLPNIEEGIGSGQEVRLCLELNEESVSKAVDSFIEYKVNGLAGRKSLAPDTVTALGNYLSSHANGTFLWVAAVCQQLDVGSLFDVMNKVKKYPRGLDLLYERMIDQVLKSDDVEACKLVLSVSTIVYRPITLDELGTIVKIDGLLALESALWREIITRCGSFLTVRDNTVYFVHQSAKDFLLETAFRRLFSEGVEAIHHKIFSESVRAMTETLRRDIYKLNSPGYAIVDVKTPVPDPLTHIRYSSLYWIDHLCDSRKTTLHDADFLECGEIYGFLHDHLLHWLEVLSLLQSVSEGMLATTKLEALVTVSSFSKFTSRYHRSGNLSSARHM